MPSIVNAKFTKRIEWKLNLTENNIFAPSKKQNRDNMDANGEGDQQASNQ